MTTSTDTSHEITIEVAGLSQRVLQDGSGEPLVVIHHEIANPGWLPFYARLAEHASVSVPDLPGYGSSARPDFARHPRDLAIMLQLLLDQMGVERAALVGLGFGGWVAAEMATMNQQRFSALVLVGAMGIKPTSGEIADQMLMSLDEYVGMGFNDPSAYGRVFGDERSPATRLQWDFAREMTARIAWKPYMFSLQLPHLLPAVKIPTLVVWGSDDQIVPLNCGEVYAQALPNARLEVVPGAGHWLDMERPDELAALVTAHLAGR